jgi:hypothetical protein
MGHDICNYINCSRTQAAAAPDLAFAVRASDRGRHLANADSSCEQTVGDMLISHSTILHDTMHCQPFLGTVTPGHALTRAITHSLRRYPNQIEIA